MLDLNSIYKLKQGIVLKSINDKYWALSTTNGNQYKLNEIAYFILNEFTDEKRVGAIIEVIRNAYKVSEQEFIEDYRIMLDKCLRNELLEEVIK